jgi:yecA family protein
MTNNLFDCDRIESALQTLEADINPSEIHGTLCGMLCATGDTKANSWFQSLVPASDNSNLLAKEAREILARLYDETRQQLNDPTCDFQLLLPDEQSDLDTRTTSLGDWCQGFVMGLMMGGLKDFRKLPEDSAEVAQDIVEISRIGSKYESEGNEEDALALEELIEYVRVGVLLINEELHPSRAAPIITPETNNIH